MTIQTIQEELIEDFALLEDWTDKYEYLIDLGKHVQPIADVYKTEDNLIKGCQSRVWLHAEKKEELIVFTADSDAIITKGIVGLLLKVFSEQSAADILAADTSFIDKIGFKEHLSPTRSNGLVSMLQQMKRYAVAFQ